MNKSRSMAAAAAALAMCMAGSAFADDRHFERGGDRYDRYERQERRWQQRHDERRYRHQDERSDRHFYRHDRHGPRPEWRRGGYVPRGYDRPNYVVTDWRAQHLHAPPQGYQWVGVGGEFALAAIATGLIAQIIANH